MKTPRTQAFSVIEFLVVVVLAAILASFVIPFSRSVPPSARQTKQINNAKQITLACALFASDHLGRFPDGNYDPALEKITDDSPAASAETCFTDLIKTGKLEVEKVYWSSYHFTQCARSTPDENGTLTGGENCWDYIAGLDNKSHFSLPLVFEASDDGTGTHWTEDHGHPWNNLVIVGYVDGTVEKVNLNKAKQAKVERDGTQVDLCLPTPGKNGWPDTAKLAPATPIPNPPK